MKWEKIFATHSTNKGIIQNEALQIEIEDNPKEKWARNVKNTFILLQKKILK